MCVSVLEHVHDDELFVRQIAGLLCPGGHAVFTVDFRDDYVEADRKPRVDVRLYTTRDICDRLMSKLPDCMLADPQTWRDGAQYFEHDGAVYGFAAWVFRRMPGSPQKYDGERFRPVRTTPWKDQLVLEIPA